MQGEGITNWLECRSGLVLARHYTKAHRLARLGCPSCLAGFAKKIQNLTPAGSTWFSRSAITSTHWYSTAYLPYLPLMGIPKIHANHGRPKKRHQFTPPKTKQIQLPVHETTPGENHRQQHSHDIYRHHRDSNHAKPICNVQLRPPGAICQPPTEDEYTASPNAST